jgi:hypothetical protein
MQESCLRCERLWQEFEEAAKQYMEIAQEMQNALDPPDASRFNRIESLLRASMDRLTEARKAIQQHESEHSR